MKNIIIAPSSYHQFLLKELRKNDSFFDVKIYSKEDLIKDYFGKYDEKIILEIIKKIHITYELAKNYVDYFPYITSCNNEKQSFLLSLKEKFHAEEFFSKNLYLKEALKDSNALIYGYSENDRLLKYVLDECLVSYKFKKNNHDFYPIVTSFSMIEDEVFYCLNKIASLIKDGVDSNDIYLMNVADEKYLYYLNLFAPSFNLKINKIDENSLFLSGFCTEFFKKYQESVSPIMIIDELKEKYQGDDVFDKIYDIIFTYYDEELPYNNQKDIYISVIKKYGIRGPLYKNAINVIAGNGLPIEHKHIFVLKMDSSFPFVYVDKDFLIDKEKQGTLLETSLEKSNLERETLLDFLRSDNYFYYSFTNMINGKKNYPSPLIDNPSKQIEESVLPDTFYSLFYMKNKFVQALDLSYLYRERSDALDLEKNIKIPYRTYDNQFSGISYENKGFLRVSYSSMNDYSNCPFKYYASRLLKLNEYEEKFSQILGTMIHKILEDIYEKDYDFEKTFEREYLFNKDKFSLRDQILLENIKISLDNAINILRKHYFEYLDNPSYLSEKEISFNIDEKTIINGKVDKVIVTKDYYLVIDYKTYSLNFSPKYLDKGIGMQLPIYGLLLDHYRPLENKKAAGYYLNVVLSNSMKDKYTDLDKVCPSFLQLNGVTITDDIDINQIDKSLMNNDKSYFIMGLSSIPDGRQNNRISTRSGFEAYKETCYQVILNNIYDIRHSKFEISPAQKGSDIACSFCDYRDICYVNKKQIRKLDVSEEDDDELLG